MDLDLFADPDAKKTLIQRYDNEPDILAIEEFGCSDVFVQAKEDNFDLLVVVPTNDADTDVAVVAEPTSPQHTPNTQYPWPGKPEKYPVRVNVKNVRYTEVIYVREAMEAAGHTWAAAWQIKTAHLMPADLFPPSKERYGSPREKAGGLVLGEKEKHNVWPDDLNPNEEYVEGAKREVTVNAYERDEKAREHCLHHHGPVCKVCGVDFGDRYGEQASGFIHVHHKVPLSEIDEEYRVNPIEDLVPVCPNCHAVIHMGDEMKSVKEVRHMLGRE